ncbi:MAG TPA: hypothetical protein VLJ15_04940 [Gammaproteobacteria bacterium]|nr:hypothetical protein [Gammaproteobacteria bacterium]
MLLKKMAMIGSVLMVSALPVAAFADLETCNQTLDTPSTVKITSGVLHPCSSSFPPGITYPGTCLTKTIAQVRAACGIVKGPCSADIYVTADCNASGAAPVGHVAIQINQTTITIASASVEDPAKYAIDLAGGPTPRITIRKVG